MIPFFMFKIIPQSGTAIVVVTLTTEASYH